VKEKEKKEGKIISRSRATRAFDFESVARRWASGKIPTRYAPPRLWCRTHRRKVEINIRSLITSWLRCRILLYGANAVTFLNIPDPIDIETPRFLYRSKSVKFSNNGPDVAFLGTYYGIVQNKFQINRNYFIFPRKHNKNLETNYKQFQLE